MKTWTTKEKAGAKAFALIAVTVGLTAAFMGFTGFKSVNLIAFMLFLSSMGAAMAVIGFVASHFSKSEGWSKLKKCGLLLTGASLAYIVTELMNPTL